MDEARAEHLRVLGTDPQTPASKRNLNIFEKIRQKKKEAHDSMFRYGPPYHAEYGGNLAEECNDSKAGTMDIHELLNEGADPRIGDPEDFNNTPLHYAVRYCHFHPKGDVLPWASTCHLLLKAGANVNQVNELGVTALGFAAMFNQPEPRQARYLKMVKWLITRGADVNVVDKGGHTPLEIASSWGNMGLVVCLIQHKAAVRRELEYLSLKGPNALEVATNPNVASLLQTKLKQEEDEAQRVKDRRRAEEFKQLIKAQRARNEARKEKEREAKREARRAMREAKRNADLVGTRASGYRSGTNDKSAAERFREREKATAARLAAEALAADANAGVWRKEAPFMWQKRRSETKAAAEGVSAMDEAKTLIEDTQGAGQRAMLQRRWRALTGHEITKDHVVMGGSAGKKQEKVR